MSRLKRMVVDVFLGTLFIFSLMGTIFGVSQFGIFDAFDPIGDALGGMEMTDLVFSRIREDPEIDTSIIIVNIGELDREGIAYQLEIINKYNPKVVTFDFDFLYRNEDSPRADSILSAAIARTDTLVMACKILQTDSLATASPGIDLYDSTLLSDPYFSKGVHFAFANLETEADKQDDFKECRRFPTTRKVNGKQLNALAVETARMYDPEKTEKFLARNNPYEIVNFRGNVVDYFGRTNYPTSYQALDYDDVLTENFVPEWIEGKIVIFGYMGKNFFDTSWDDKFFTPLNLNYVGRTNPDMFGVVIHANIVSMILKQDYINTMSDNVGLLVAFLLCLVNVWVFSWIYRRLPRWYDGITKLLQVIELALLVAVMIFAFHWYSFKLNLTITIAAIALAGDGLEVYYGVVKNLFRKESRKQLFTIQKD